MFRVRVICSLFIFLLNPESRAQSGLTCAALENFSITPLNINSGLNEYAPVFTNGKLLFTSDNRARLGLYFSSVDSLEKLSSIYLAIKQNDTTFSEPKLIDTHLNACYNSGPAWINSAGNQLFFSSNEGSSFLVVTSKKKGKLRIYTSKLNRRKWSERSKLSFCTGDFNYTHPYMNRTEDTLYFSSDRSGGFGGFDIYYSVLKNSAWSDPINMGALVNSPQNELFPSFDEVHVVFSSNREQGFGNLDLYSYDIARKQLLHKGKPFNSEYDDFSFAVLDSKSGYFSSNRSGNDEIYFYKELFPDFRDCEAYVKDPFCFTFFEEEVDELDEALDLEYAWSFGDGTNAKGKEARHCFGGYGEYLVELNIIDHTTSEVYFNQTSYPFVIERTKRLHIEGPDTVSLAVNATFTGLNSSIPDSKIVRFFWQLDDGALNISDTSTFAFTSEKEGVHQIKMGVHMLTEAGEQFRCITKSLTIIKDYQQANTVEIPPLYSWERNPVVNDPNDRYTLFLGVDDTLTNNASLNGKGQLRIQPVVDSLFLYSMGISKQKTSFVEDYRIAREMGFSNSRVVQIKDGQLIQSEKLAHTPLVELEHLLDNRIRQEQVLASFELFYNFDAFELTEENKKQLKDFVENHRLTADNKVLINSYTDLKGNNSYNLKLSGKRSLAVRDELVKNGFPIEQIELEYDGKRVPLNMQPLSDAQRRKSLIIIYEKK